jgi:hypothetical protein
MVSRTPPLLLVFSGTIRAPIAPDHIATHRATPFCRAFHTPHGKIRKTALLSRFLSFEDKSYLVRHGKNSPVEPFPTISSFFS